MENINKIRITLDKPRYLLLDMGAVARFEYNSGKPIFCLKTWQRMSRKEMMLLLWACLVHEDARLTPADVVRMFQNKNIDADAVGKKLVTAWGLLIFNLTGGGK